MNTLLVIIVHHTTRGHVDWLPEDMNKGKLDYFYWLLVGLGVVNIGCFLYKASKYQYRENLEVNYDGNNTRRGEVELSSPPHEVVENPIG